VGGAGRLILTACQTGERGADPGDEAGADHGTWYVCGVVAAIAAAGFMR
jgi:hypothetical protein